MMPLWLILSEKIDRLLADIISGEIEASVKVVDRLMELKKTIQDDYNERIKHEN